MRERMHPLSNPRKLEWDNEGYHLLTHPKNHPIMKVGLHERTLAHTKAPTHTQTHLFGPKPRIAVDDLS